MNHDIYRQELNNLLASGEARPEQITAARGRLIAALNRDISNSNDENIIDILRHEAAHEMALYQNQLNNRLHITKRTDDGVVSQIANEVSIKSRKVSNSTRQFFNSNSVGEYVTNGTRVVGNALSTAYSVAKAPLLATLRLSSLAVPLLTTILVQPLQIPAYLFSKIINPDSKYNGQIVTSCGRGIGNLIASGLNLSADIVRRI